MIVLKPGDDVQAAIDAAVGPGDPTETVRAARESVFLSAGTYPLGAPLRVWGVQFFALRGEGGCTRLVPDFEGEAALDLNGVAYCTFSDLLIQGSGRERLGAAVRLRREKATALRSTTSNRLDRIDVMNCRFTQGILVGDAADGPGQVDQTQIDRCNVYGDWTPGGPDWQAAVQVGNGVWGNNLVHHARGLQLAGCAAGLRVAASQVCLDGFGCQRNGVDFAVDATSYFRASGGRSEGSGRLYQTGGPAASPACHTLADIDWHAERLADDRAWVWFRYGGTLRLAGVSCRGAPPGIVPRILTDSWAPHAVLIDGLSAPGPPREALSLGPRGRADVRGWQ